MAILRLLAISILAAFAGCVISSVILSGEIDPFVFLPLIFALPGAIGILAPGYAALRERGTPLVTTYVLLVVLGFCAGGAMLGMVSLDGAWLGSLYGTMTALSWVALHFSARLTFPAAGVLGPDRWTWRRWLAVMAGGFGVCASLVGIFSI